MSIRDDFEKIIERVQINSSTPQVEIDRQCMPMIQFLRTNIPEQLFKFRACADYSIEAFEMNQLWLATADSYNDIHDSLLYIDKNAILDSIRNTISYEKLPSAIEMMKQMQNLSSDFLKVTMNLLSSIKNDQFTGFVERSMSNLDQYMDQCFSHIKNNIRNHRKMVCLSENIKSPLMWAHYANYHKGFALGYDFRNNEITQCSNCSNRSCVNLKAGMIYPVIYSDKRYNVTKYGQWIIQQQINRMLGTYVEETYDDEFLFTKAALYKSNDWSYEAEWRMICSTPNSVIEQQRSYSINKRPVAIYFGCQIPKFYKKMLMRIADEKNIPRYQMYVKDYSSKYELDYRPI